MAAITLAAFGLSGCAGPTPDVIIRHVTLIDGTDRGPRPNMSVAITADRIVAVEPDDQARPSRGTRVIDGTGKVLIPGLWDMHVHLLGYDEGSFPLFLANGVTSIRDVGDDLGLTSRLRTAAGTEVTPGPRILMAGPSLNGEVMIRGIAGTLREGAGVAVTSPARADTVVDSLARAKVDLIKVHAAVSRDVYLAVAAAARRHGLALAGHVPDGMTPRQVIDAGQRTIEHGSGLEFANAADGDAIAERARVRFQRYLDSAGAGARPGDVVRMRLAASAEATAAYDSLTAAAFARDVATRPVWIDPTLVTYRLFVRMGEPALWDLPEGKYVPARAKTFDEFPRPTRPATAAELADGARQWDEAKLSFAELVRAGARFIAGTDVPVGPLVPGFSLHQELELLREIGLTPYQVLQAATRNAADAAGVLNDVGTIETGKVADLVMLDADPLANLRNVAAIRAVVLRGRVFDRDALDRLLASSEASAKQP